MIKKNISEILRQDEIIKSYQKGYSIEKISEHFNLTYNEVLALLEYYKISVPNRNLTTTVIRRPEILIVSDTHIGSEKERLDLLHDTYDYAYDKHIQDIIHTGDLFQAGVKPVKLEYTLPENQFNHFMDTYPVREGITTHVLLGNHDLKLLNKDNDFMKVLCSRKDMNILGFKRAYLIWMKTLVSLYHECQHYHMNIPNVDTKLHIYGHKHAFSENKRNLTVPTISADAKYYADAISEPGFILAEQDKKIADFKLMVFRDSGIKEQGKVYRYKL